MTETPDLLPVLCRLAASAATAIAASLAPAFPYLALCTAFVFLDCWSAWRLAVRARAAHPGRASGKLRSEKMRHIFATLAEIYAVVLLAHFTQIYITSEMPVDVAKIVSGAICGWQFWSYLENQSSCNGAKWAKAARKIFIDKTSRHFDLDADDLLKDS